MYTLAGTALSEGIAAGSALTIAGPKVSYTRDNLYESDPEREIERFLKKSVQFANRLRQIVNPSKDSVRDLAGAAAAFITDKKNADEVISIIKQGCSANMACRTVLLGNLDAFGNSSDPELQANKKELTSLTLEFINSLQHTDDSNVSIPKLKSGAVIIAKDLTPALFLCLDTDLVKAVILEGGRDSSHLSVVLKELGIPAVYGVFGATSIANGTRLLVDGNCGVVIVDPPAETERSMLSKQDLFLEKINDESLINVTIACSVGTVRRTADYELYTTHGLGLLRSEFLFLNYEREPSEEEMFRVFKKLFVPIRPGAPITARTFDFAEDKKPLFSVRSDESGPLKGYGACVSGLLLKKEIRALLKAAAGRTIRIVFPLVTRLGESRFLRELTCKAAAELKHEHQPCADFETALMIETPAAVFSAPALAKECSMVIIGTSSLAEYACAPCTVDSAFTPVLAKMIVMAAKAANDAGVPIGIAGRFAPRTELLAFFYKLGVSYIVVGGYHIEKVRADVERLNLEHEINPCFSESLYRQVMDLYTGKELNKLITDLDI